LKVSYHRPSIRLRAVIFINAVRKPCPGAGLVILRFPNSKVIRSAVFYIDRKRLRPHEFF